MLQISDIKTRASPDLSTRERQTWPNYLQRDLGPRNLNGVQACLLPEEVGGM